MDYIFIPLIIGLILISYTAVSYPVLKHLGVQNELWKRSFKFGLALLLIQTVSSGVLTLLGIPLAGSILGLIGSYYYVASVLQVSKAKNIGIILLLPMAALLLLVVVLLPFIGLLNIRVG